MIGSVLGIVVFAAIVPFVARGGHPAARPTRRSPARDCAILGLLLLGLLAVPFAGFDLLWLTGWRSAYLVYGLVAIPLALWSSGGRPADIGFRPPVKGWPRYVVAAMVGLLLLARVAEPFVTHTPVEVNARALLMNAVIFALMEEALFRGIMQTRLESVLGRSWAWITTALFFGFYHYYVLYLVPGRSLDVAAALQLAYLTAFGLLLGIVYARSRSLLPSYLIHAANNLSL